MAPAPAKNVAPVSRQSYCGHWALPPKGKQAKEKRPSRGGASVAARAKEKRRPCRGDASVAAKVRAVATPQRRARVAAPKTPPKKIAAKVTTTPSKTLPSASPARALEARDSTVELVQEIQDFKQAIAWEKFGVPGPIFHGLVATGENCLLQQMLEEVNDTHIKCTCNMCLDCKGGNYPDTHKLPDGLLGQPFVKVEEDKCKLFSYLAAKAAQFELPPLTKLPAAPSSMTLVTRLSKEAETQTSEPWLRQVWQLPYAKQVDFFGLVHAICSEVMPEDTGPFQHWFRFYGKSLLPVDAIA
mmetsp:Transcript_80864/g.212290  ORF Transcript_80864/g.212290 Transcript_80864/m.212290 type:complete len:299 (-) Transcript_80864:204-1100(-)